jgi:hypothetical protein
MEWIKVRSLRSTWWLLVMTWVAMLAGGLGVGLGYRSHTPVAPATQIANNALAGAVLGQLLFGALGVLMVGGEYSAGTMRSTVLAAPRRAAVLAAKATVCTCVTLPVALLGCLMAHAAAQLAITSSPVSRLSLLDGRVVRTVLATALYLTAVALIGLGLGAIIRHAAGAVGALFAGIVIPMIIAGMFGEAGIAVSRFVPMMMLANSIIVTAPVSGTLSAAAAVAVMTSYAVTGLTIGAVLLRRRDV